MANAVEIIISASDKASGTIAGVTSSLGAVASAAQSTVPVFRTLTDSIATFSQNSLQAVGKLATPFTLLGTAATAAISPVSALGGSIASLLVSAASISGTLLTPFSLISSTLLPIAGIVTGTVDGIARLNRSFIELSQNPIINTAIVGILQEAEDAVQKLDGSLTETFSGLGEIGAPLIGGAIPAFDKLQQKAVSTANSTVTVYVDAGNKIGNALASGLNAADRAIQKVLEKAERVPKRIAESFDSIANVFGGIAGFDEPLAVFDALRNSVGGVTAGAFALTQEIAFFSSGLQALQQIVVSGPFELLIGQNVRLREQLLATQSTLAATNKVFQGGVQITDPGQAIQSLEVPVNKAIEDIRKGSLELVGVTSNELVDAFQIVAGQAANVGLSLNQASDLTLSFSAALGTLGIPLAQARQEIGSILQGTIDQNSVLAKSLGISNQQVEIYRRQGTLFEELTRRLEAFRAGNALAAQSLSGVTSNIEEIFQEIGRQAGAPLLEPLVSRLSQFYEFLKANQRSLVSGTSNVAKEILRAGEAAVDIIATVFNSVEGTLGQIPLYLFESVANALESLADAVSTVVPILEPLLVVFAELAQSAYALGGPFLRLFLQFKVASGAISLLSSSFGVLAQTLPGIGELLFFLTGRNSSLLRSFIGLRGELGTGAAGFLLLGRNLASLPPLVNLLANQFPIFGGAIAAAVPSIAALATQGFGIIKSYPQVATIFQRLTSTFPTLAKNLEPLAEQILPGLGAKLAQSADFASKFGVALGNSVPGDRIKAIEGLTGASDKFSGLLKQLGEFAARSAIKFALLTTGLIAAIQIFDRLILQNEGLLEILNALGSGLSSIAGVIASGLTSPIGLATIALTAATAAMIKFSIATKIQGVGALIEFAKAQTLATATTLAPSLLNTAKALSAFGLVAKGGAVSMAALQASLAAGSVSLTAFAATAALVAAPLIAIGGAIALTALVRYTNDLKDAQEALDAYRQANDVVADSAIRFASRLKTVRDEQKKQTEEGSVLTEEQKRQNEILIEQGKLQLAGLDEQIEKLKAAQAATKDPAQQQAYQNEIDSLTKLRSTVDGYVNDVTLAGDAVLRLQNRLKSLDEELKRATASIDTQQKEQIAALTEGIQAGVVAQSEAEEAKLQLTKEGYQQQLAATTQGLQELIDRYNQLSPEERERAKDVQDQITALRGQAADLRTKIAESEIAEQTRLIEKFAKEGQRKIIEAEAKRNIQVANLRNQGLITEEEASQERLQTAKERIQNELKLENEKLQQLLQNEAANGDAIKESRQRLLELTQQALDNEAQIYDAHIALIKSKLEDQALAYANSLEDQNQKLRAQQTLYETLGSALSTQLSLLETQRDLISGAGDFLNSQLGVLSSLERSDFRRRQLAQATAAINLQSLLQRQETEQQIFEIQLEQNRLALERQQIENEIAQIQAQAAVARGEADVQVARQELAAGRITQAEFDARVLTQQANILNLGATQRQGDVLARQVALQPQQEAAARQQFEQRQLSERTQGIGSLVETLPPGARRNAARNALFNQISQQLGFEDAGDLRRSGVNASRQAANQIANGQPIDTRFFEQLTPNTQRRVNALQSAEKATQGFDAPIQAQISPDLQRSLDGFSTTVQQLGSVEQLRSQNSQIRQLATTTQTQQNFPSTGGAPRQLTQQQIQAIIDYQFGAGGGFGGRSNTPITRDSPQQTVASTQARVDAPINVTINVDSNDAAKAIEQQVDQRLTNVVRRAQAIAGR